MPPAPIAPRISNDPSRVPADNAILRDRISALSGPRDANESIDPHERALKLGLKGRCQVLAVLGEAERLNEPSILRLLQYTPRRCGVLADHEGLFVETGTTVGVEPVVHDRAAVWSPAPAAGTADRRYCRL